jgi:hypothetical protein
VEDRCDAKKPELNHAQRPQAEADARAQDKGSRSEEKDESGLHAHELPVARERIDPSSEEEFAEQEQAECQEENQSHRPEADAEQDGGVVGEGGAGRSAGRTRRVDPINRVGGLDRQFLGHRGSSGRLCRNGRYGAAHS